MCDCYNLFTLGGFFIIKMIIFGLILGDMDYLEDKESNFIDQVTKLAYFFLYQLVTPSDVGDGKAFDFPLGVVSLNDLCKNFDVVGKTSKYNEEFNSISLFDNQQLLKEFLDYSLQDSNSLFNALTNAQELYFHDYKVDITSIFSTSTLSLKIFRQQFLDTEIPIMKKSEDSFVRKSYK